MINGLIVRINRRRPWLKLVILGVLVVMVVTVIVTGANWNSENTINNQKPDEAPQISDSGLLEPVEREKSQKVVDEPAQVEKPPVESHEERISRLRNGKIAVLTFDDGPWPDTTNRLLDVLKEKNVKASFFILGQRAEAYPEIVRREGKDGHELNSHTHSHQNLVYLSTDEIRNEVNMADNAICKAAAREAGCVTFVRPPYGNSNPNVAGAIDKTLMGWSIDTLDWKIHDVNSILQNTLNAITDSAVILMHDIYPATVDAVGPMIDELRAGGYELVTLSELIEIRGEPLDRDIMYGRFDPRM